MKRNELENRPELLNALGVVEKYLQEYRDDMKFYIPEENLLSVLEAVADTAVSGLCAAYQGCESPQRL